MDIEHTSTDSLIPPAQLKRFLGANRWAIVEDHRNEWEVWRAPEELKSPTVTLLFDNEYFDYDTRLFEANKLIQRAYRIDAVELNERIASLSADLFFVRIDQFSRDGTIPFKQAQRALESIATMVRAAATTTANPAHSHRGRRPTEVEEFIADKLRLGHTKKGSFIVTAVARFDDESAELIGRPNVGTDTEDAVVDEQAVVAEPDLEPADTARDSDDAQNVDLVLPFGRRVMRTLSLGLDAARRVADEQTPIGTAIDEGLSLELVEALEKISNEEGLHTIDVTFDWSPSLPQPTDVPARVVFEQSTIESLPTVTELLQVRHKPETSEIVGSVIGLTRSIANGEPSDSGAVTIRADIDGSFRKITVELDGLEHEWAIRAYREHFPVIVSGELVKRGSWRLEGNVSLDVVAAEQLATRRSNVRSADPSRVDEKNVDSRNEQT